MRFDELINRAGAFLFFLGNMIVFSAALHAYLATRRHVLLLFVVSGAVGAFRTAFPWLLFAADSTISPTSEWYATTLLSVIDVALWTSGFCLLMNDYKARWRTDE